MRIAVDICCNDPDNGIFDYRAPAIQIDMIGPRMREIDCGIAISNKHWPVLRSEYGVGNWCWNRYWMDVDSAVAFFAWLHGQRRFDVEQAEERLFAAWKSVARFPVNIFREILIRKAAQ